MTSSNIMAEFSDGLKEINLSSVDTKLESDRTGHIKKTTSSVYDLAALGSSKGDIWNWGMYDEGLAKEIEALLPGFGKFDTDGFSEQLYFLALRDLPLEFGDYAGTSVAEIGCGMGEGLNFLSRIVDAQMIGLDLSPMAVRRANATLSRGTQLHFVEGDAENLPFEDGELDVVINIESSHTYPDLGRFFAEVHRVLKPGGHFSYIDVFTANRYELMHNKLANSPGLELINDRDISELVKASVLRRLAPDSRFSRTFSEKRLPLRTRVIAGHARKVMFGAKFAGYQDDALIRALKAVGLLPDRKGLPMDSYRHLIARKAA
jgi:SAM-dependent methyltransferase